MNDPVIKVLVLPGGKLPVQGRLGDVGFDAHTRAIVSLEYDPNVPGMRKTLWDLQGPPTPFVSDRAHWEDGKWKYHLPRGERVTLGLGLIFGGSSTDWCADLAERSFGASQGVQILNYFGNVIIDPNFRGEPIALIENRGSAPVVITHGWSFAQFKFTCKCCQGGGFLRPILEKVHFYEELEMTSRGTAMNGSSDTRLFQPEFGFDTRVHGNNGALWR